MATADDDDDDAYVSLKCENDDAVGSHGEGGLGAKRGHIIASRNKKTTTPTKTTTTYNRTNTRSMSKRSPHGAAVSPETQGSVVGTTDVVGSVERGSGVVWRPEC